MWNLKRNDTNELTYRTERDLENKLMVAEGEGTVGNFGEVMYTLLYLKWTTNNYLLYSTEDSDQCFVAAWMGEEFEENGYMYMCG